LQSRSSRRPRRTAVCVRPPSAKDGSCAKLVS
jgi:hypothetical protein